MTKTLLSACIAALCAAPLATAANPVVYGRVNVNLVMDHGDGSGTVWDVQDKASRVGVQGSEDLGGGLSAIYQLEFGVDAGDSGDLSGRLAFAGLTGGFGTIAVGRQWAPYYMTVDLTDIFQVEGMNTSYLGPLRVGNAAAYATPKLGGLSAVAAVIINGDGVGDDPHASVDAANLSLDYSNGPFSLGVSVLRDNAAKTDLVGVAGRGQLGDLALIAQYEELADTNDSAWAVAAEAYIGDNTLRALYGATDDGSQKLDHWVVGLEHHLSKSTRVFLEHENSDDGSPDATRQRVGLGLRHDF